MSNFEKYLLYFFSLHVTLVNRLRIATFAIGCHTRIKKREYIHLQKHTLKKTTEYI